MRPAKKRDQKSARVPALAPVAESHQPATRQSGPVSIPDLAPRAILQHEFFHGEMEEEAKEDAGDLCPECGRGPERSHSKCREYEVEQDKYGL